MTGKKCFEMCQTFRLLFIMGVDMRLLTNPRRCCKENIQKHGFTSPSRDLWRDPDAGPEVNELTLFLEKKKKKVRLQMRLLNVASNPSAFSEVFP